MPAHKKYRSIIYSHNSSPTESRYTTLDDRQTVSLSLITRIIASGCKIFDPLYKSRCVLSTMYAKTQSRVANEPFMVESINTAEDFFVGQRYLNSFNYCESRRGRCLIKFISAAGMDCVWGHRNLSCSLQNVLIVRVKCGNMSWKLTCRLQYTFVWFDFIWWGIIGTANWRCC